VRSDSCPPTKRNDKNDASTTLNIESTIKHAFNHSTLDLEKFRSTKKERFRGTDFGRRFFVCVCSRERPLPVEHAGDAVTCEAEPVTLALLHGVLGQLRIAPCHRQGGFPALRLQIQADLPVVFHRRDAGGDQGLAGPVHAAGHLHVAPLVRPPVHHRPR